MRRWTTLPLGEVDPIVRWPIKLDRSARYREIGARSFGKGLFAKPEFDGAAATWEKPVLIAKGDLVFSNVKVRDGAISGATDVHDGCIASHRYVTCVPRADLAAPEFWARYLLSTKGLAPVGQASRGNADRNRTLSLVELAAIPVPVPPLSYQLEIYFRTPDVWRVLAAASGGTNVRRRRLQPSAFLAHAMPVLPMKTQVKICDLQAQAQVLKRRYADIRKANDALIPATLERISQPVGA